MLFPVHEGKTADVGVDLLDARLAMIPIAMLLK